MCAHKCLQTWVLEFHLRMELQVGGVVCFILLVFVLTKVPYTELLKDPTCSDFVSCGRFGDKNGPGPVSDLLTIATALLAGKISSFPVMLFIAPCLLQRPPPSISLTLNTAPFLLLLRKYKPSLQNSLAVSNQSSRWVSAEPTASRTHSCLLLAAPAPAA